MYDFETEKWSKLPDVPTKRVFALYYSTNTHIYSMGGVKEDPRQGFSDAAEVFDVEKGTVWVGRGGGEIRVKCLEDFNERNFFVSIKCSMSEGYMVIFNVGHPGSLITTHYQESACCDCYKI